MKIEEKRMFQMYKSENGNGKKTRIFFGKRRHVHMKKGTGKNLSSKIEIVAIYIQPLKATFGLSITSLAFLLFYAICVL